MFWGEIHLHKRIDQLSAQAEQFLEELPIEATREELNDDPLLWGTLLLYEEAIEYINVIRQELRV